MNTGLVPLTADDVPGFRVPATPAPERQRGVIPAPGRNWGAGRCGSVSALSNASGSPRNRVASRERLLPIGKAVKFSDDRNSAGDSRLSPARVPENMIDRSAANTNSARKPAKQLPGSINANRLRDVAS